MKPALYLHFPYCRSRCTYCDFNAYVDAGEGARQDYIEALCADIRSQERYQIATLFCGGGTPSLHSPEQFAQVFQACREAFDFYPRELTLEANPGTLNPEQLRGLRQVGFDRISLGVQSFRSQLLESLNRIHSPEEVEQAVEWARAAGFENLSLDLIYGLPGQKLQDWSETLERALALRPDHLSVYQLTVEPGTHLLAQIQRGEVQLPAEELTYRMDRMARKLLHRAGLRRYEVSNWCRPGKAARHNLIYWKDQAYLGLGCGATGFIRGWRIRRLLHPYAYQQALARGASPVASAERRDHEGALRDCLMMGLRTRQGVNWKRLRARFPGLRKGKMLAFLERLPRNWWKWEGSQLRLTSKGVDFTSSVCEEMMDVLLLT